jgi:hypothetical protein
MSDVKTEILENGRILLVTPSEKNAVVPVFCPVCSFPMRTLEDSIAFRTNEACAHCEMHWSRCKFGKWEDGWRPSGETEGWNDYLIYRKALSRVLITIR